MLELLVLEELVVVELVVEVAPGTVVDVVETVLLVLELEVVVVVEVVVEDQPNIKSSNKQ